MALDQTYKKSEQFLIPEDTYVATLYSAVDLGTHDTGFTKIDKEGNDTGQPVIQNKLKLSFEFQDLAISDGRPAASSRKYTASLHEKADLRGILHALLGGDSKATEYLNTDGLKLSDALQKVLGKPALVTISHKTAGAGSAPFALITSVAPLPKAMQKSVKPLVNKQVLITDVNDISKELFDSLPKNTQETINKRLNNTNSYASTDAEGEVPF